MSTITAAFTVAAANFCFIGLKAFQQRNVIHNNYQAVFGTSMGLAIFEVYVVAQIAKSGFDAWLVLALGVGGGAGCLAAMWLHNRFFKKAG